MNLPVAPCLAAGGIVVFGRGTCGGKCVASFFILGSSRVAATAARPAGGRSGVRAGTGQRMNGARIDGGGLKQFVRVVSRSFFVKAWPIMPCFLHPIDAIAGWGTGIFCAVSGLQIAILNPCCGAAGSPDAGNRYSSAVPACLWRGTPGW